MTGRGRTRRTVEQRRELVAEYRASGLGQTAYCREHGINLGTFCQWLRGRGLGGSGQRRPRFAQVAVPWQRSTHSVEIELPTGIRVRVTDATHLAAVLPAIRELAAC